MAMLVTTCSILLLILYSFLNPYTFLTTSLIVIAILYYFSSKSKHVYLIDYCCYQPPNALRVPLSSYMEHCVRSEMFHEDSIEFLSKVSTRAGIGNEASFPVSMHQLPPDGSLKHSLQEIETVLFSMIEDLLVKHDLSPKSIDILISNSGHYCAIPSITAMVINKFKFRSNIRSYNITGMGCSSGLLSISLAKDLLTVHKNSLALVVSTESLTSNLYTGRNKSMLLSNTLFRTGGAAILLTNRRQDKATAKYELQHLVRVHMGSDDSSYNSIRHDYDENGIDGIKLSPTLLHVARDSLTINMVRLGPLVLPYSEQVRYLWSVIIRKLWPPSRQKEVFMPDFKKAFDHFCIHAGGRAVIHAVEESLRLCEEDGEPSRMTLYRFGNTSSTSVWYELCYLEAKGRVKMGNKVWQISFGSGFKCNSAVWKCISKLDPNTESAWSDRIHLYPVEIPEVIDH